MSRVGRTNSQVLFWSELTVRSLLSTKRDAVMERAAMHTIFFYSTWNWTRDPLDQSQTLTTTPHYFFALDLTSSYLYISLRFLHVLVFCACNCSKPCSKQYTLSSFSFTTCSQKIMHKIIQPISFLSQQSSCWFTYSSDSSFHDINHPTGVHL